MTEYPNVINVINRMNIWQEIFLGFIYKIIKKFYERISPIEFYVNSVILLQTLSISSIFILSLIINYSLLGGILSVAFYTLNRHAMSRVAYLLPLRENFALPFWWVHVLTFHLLIRSTKPSALNQRFIRYIFYLSTFLFCMQWQFSQFVILLESGVIFVLDMFEFVSRSDARCYYWTCLISLLGTSAMQMGNLMLLSSFTLAMLISSLILGSYKTPEMMHSSFSGRLTWISMQSTGRLLLAFLLRLLSTWILLQNDDSHIFQFLAVKFGIGSSRNFDVNLYNCHEGFGWMPIDKFLNSLNMVTYPSFIVYICLGLALMVSALSVLWHDTEEEEELHPSIHESIVGAEGDFCSGCGHLLSNYPELAYHFGLSSSMLVLTLMVQRMQYLLTPYFAIFSSIFYSNRVVYDKIAKMIVDLSFIYYQPPVSIDSNDNYKKSLVSHRTNVISQVMEWSRQAIVIALICKISFEAFHNIRTELNDLREFYDPDTVQLMAWIRHSTNSTDSFSGSMQLMAAVKLIGKRPIVNHPHYEDYKLRKKTQKLYQIYAKKDAKYVARILKQYEVSHIILEDSICLAKSNGCQLKDIIDLSNGHIPERRYFSDFDLDDVRIPRFCNEIRFLNSVVNNSFSKYFQERFVNPTFRVYRVL